MVWFKADDQLSRSKKVLRIPRRYRMQAMGLWILAGTWSAGELTDGFVPSHMLDELGGTAAQAKRLVESGLWSEVAGGFQFNSWSDFQPSSNDVREKRARDAERKQKAREEKRRRATQAADQGRSEDVRADAERTDRGVLTESTRSPQSVRSTRPDPTRPDPFINTASSSPNGEQGDGKSASQDFHHPPELGPTVRRLLAAGHDPTVVEAAVAAWDARPAPKGPGLLPHLLADAEATIAAAHAEADRRSATHARMESVRQCLLCDETGHIVGDDGAPLVPAILCTHQEDANSELVLAARERIEAQEAAEAERRAIAAKAAAEARARWKRNTEPQEVPSGPF